MGTGPSPTQGYDLAMTELLDEVGHRFVITAGSPDGEDVLAHIPSSGVTIADTVATAEVVAGSVAVMAPRVLDTDGIRDLLYANAEHPGWDDVASR